MTMRLLSLAVAIFAAAPLQATVLTAMDLGRLSHDAGTIAHGRVLEVEAVWTRNGRQIDSLVTLEVEDYLKGGPARHLTFRTPGGQIGELRSVVPGAPQLAPGDEVVAFLEPRADAPQRLVGLSQGLLRVRVDAAGQRWVSAPEELQAQLREQAIPRRVPLPLHELSARVRRLASGAVRQ